MNPIKMWVQLEAAGYRPMDQDRTIWGKPVGTTILLFDLSKGEWRQLFKAAGDPKETHVYLGRTFNPEKYKDAENPLSQFLLECEAAMKAPSFGYFGDFWHFGTRGYLPDGEPFDLKLPSIKVQ